MQEITGRIFKTIYRSEKNGFTVALFYCLEEQDDVIITGYLPLLSEEHNYKLTGEWTDHPKYGVQFKIESFEKILPSAYDNIVSFFSSPRFPTIGKVTAARIADALGEKAIELIKEDPSCLDRVPKLTRKQKEIIAAETLNTDDEEDKYGYLMAHHLSMKAILKIEHEYKERMMAVLREDPYQVIANVENIGFETMDKFALATGFNINSQCRLKALIEAGLTDICFQSGDTYCQYEELLTYCEKKLYGIDTDIEELIAELVDERRIIQEDDRVYPLMQFRAENYIAQFLTFYPAEGFAPVERDVIVEEIGAIERKLGITYQEKQKEAIEAFFENDLMILTGGPGTGKTTIVRGMVELCRKIYPYYTITLCAPTGRAAKRMAELTDCQARTIHSLLGYNMESGKFAKDENDPILADLLIVDEFSMVDNLLFYNLLKACGAVRKIIIIGDSDQLPSVNSGALLRDFIDCDLFKVVKLEKIYRQKEGSDIITLASDIRLEQCDEINTENDIRFYQCDPVEARRLILQVVERAVNSFDNQFEGFMNVQVLAPKYKGPNGIDNLNVELQKKFNPYSPAKKQLKVGYRTFRENDKILQLKNQPDDDVYNGDIGIITEIVPAEEDFDGKSRIIADFDGVIVEYTSDTFSNIALGYCISVHKSQGSEYPIVIVPILPEYSFMLQKRLVYTAVTRANRNLIMLGNRELFFKAIRQHDNYQRRTTMKQRLAKAMMQQT